MKEVLFIAFSAVLFVILSPGVFLSLPKRGGLLVKTACHAVIFAVVLFIVDMVISKKSQSHAENFKEGAKTLFELIAGGVNSIPVVQRNNLDDKKKKFDDNINKKLSKLPDVKTKKLTAVLQYIQYVGLLKNIDWNTVNTGTLKSAATPITIYMVETKPDDVATAVSNQPFKMSATDITSTWNSTKTTVGI